MWPASGGLIPARVSLKSYTLAATGLFEELGRGLKVKIGIELPLIEAAKAQAQLEAGATVGSILLRP